MSSSLSTPIIEESDYYIKYTSSKQDNVYVIILISLLSALLVFMIYIFLELDGKVKFSYYSLYLILVSLPFIFYILKHRLSKLELTVFHDHITIEEGFLIFISKQEFPFKNLRKAETKLIVGSGTGPIGKPITMSAGANLDYKGLPNRAIRLRGKAIDSIFGKRIPKKHVKFYIDEINGFIQDYHAELKSKQ